MRQKFSVFAVAMMVLILLPLSSYAVPRLSVRKFENKTGEAGVPAAAITDMMITELSKTGIFSLLERESLDYAADEIRLGQSGLVDPSTAIEVGKIIGAQYSMTGAVTMYFYNEKSGNRLFRKLTGGIPEENTAYVMLDIRIIDNETGRDIYAHNEMGSARRSARVSASGGVTKEYGGILEEATRNAVKRHVARIASDSWK